MGRTFRILAALGLRALLLALALKMGLGSELKAQPAAPDGYRPDRLLATVEEALSDPYGQAVVKEFGAILHDSADEACLKAKGLGREQLDTRAADLLRRYGQKVVDASLGMMDPNVFEDELTRLGGKNARAEMRRLASDPAVKAYLAKMRLLHRDKVVDLMTEYFDRYRIVRRYDLRRDLNPLNIGNQSLIALHREETVKAEIEALAEKNKSNRRFQRFVTLAEHGDEARFQAMMAYGKKHALNPAINPPFEAFAGIETEIADLCITFPTKRGGG